MRPMRGPSYELMPNHQGFTLGCWQKDHRYLSCSARNWTPARTCYNQLGQDITRFSTGSWVRHWKLFFLMDEADSNWNCSSVHLKLCLAFSRSSHPLLFVIECRQKRSSQCMACNILRLIIILIPAKLSNRKSRVQRVVKKTWWCPLNKCSLDKSNSQISVKIAIFLLLCWLVINCPITKNMSHPKNMLVKYIIIPRQKHLETTNLVDVSV